MSDTIFTRLLKGELPCAKIYEDDLVFAIMDAGQVNPGHVLVISKAPYATILDADDATLARMMVVAKKMAAAIQAAYQPDGLTLLQSNKAAGWQTVPHIHVHVVPRYTNDAADLIWPRNEPNLETLNRYADKLRAALTKQV